MNLKNYTYSEIRKKILFFAPIFAGIFILHLIGVYIYEGGKSIGVRGGSINIGLIGEAPEMPNPLDYTKDKYHDLILRFLFRSSLNYDAQAGEYKGDIATCDISDLSKIHCTLRPNQRWSDGTDIQVEDIISTYQTFRTKSVSEKMQTFLKNVSITSKKDDEFDITSKEKNSLVLDLLTYPIVRSDMLERIKTGRISKDGYITSGPYRFLEKEKNAEHGYDRITIERDEKNGGEGWLDKYHFLFFPNLASLERSADILTLIVPPIKGEKIAVSPRFDSYLYQNYEYIGLFSNTDRLGRDIRRQLYPKIEESFSGKVDTDEVAVGNIFDYTGTLDPIKNEKNLSDVMRAIGYTKPDEQIAYLSQQDGLLTGSSIDYGNTKYFNLPTSKKIFFTEDADGDILLAGTVPTNTKKVYINGYELQEYRTGNTKFSYRVSREKGTLIEGKNVYALELEDISGARNTVDNLTVYHSTKKEDLDTMRKNVDDEYLKVLNAPEKVKARLEVIEKERTRLKTLDPKYFYNEKGEVFELTIAYKDDPLSLKTYATLLAGALENLSIKSTLITLSTRDLQKMLETGNKDYDYMIIGFEANSRLSRVGQVFLSTEAKNGINFAKIESKKLDGLFAKLRVAGVQSETESVQKEILQYMKDEAFFLPISSPLHTFYVDKNLKGVKKITLFQDISTLHSVLATASIKDTYLIQTEGKGFFSFFGWIFAKAFSL